MRKIVLLSVCILSSLLSVQAQTPTADAPKEKKHVVMLNKETFLQKVYNYEKEQGQSWTYLGELPCLIDFYADWCGPCRMISPILEELAKEYEGKIVIYKIDTQVERELAAVFQVRSLPTLLFIPKGDVQPIMTMGARGKEQFKQMIDEILLATKAPVEEVVAPATEEAVPATEEVIESSAKKKKKIRKTAKEKKL